MDIHQLQQLTATPRQHPKGIHPKPRTISNRRKQSWLAAMRFGPLVLTAVVQANLRLYEPGKVALPAVVLYTTDPARRLDGRFLRAVVDLLHQVKADPHLPDPELQRVQDLLLDHHSYFHLTLPPRLSWGVPTVMGVEFLRRGLLPGRCLPPDGLLPAVIGEDSTVYVVKPSAYRSLARG